MTKSQILDKISNLEAQKKGYEDVKTKLEDELEELGTQAENLSDGVLDPISEPYMLAGEDSVDWIGLNYNTAEEMRGTIATDISTYDGEIGTLSSEISEAINEVQAKIDELAKEISELYEMLPYAPDEELTEY